MTGLPREKQSAPTDPWIRLQLLGGWVRKERSLVAALMIAALIALGVGMSQRDRSAVPLEADEVRNLTELPLNPASGK